MGTRQGFRALAPLVFELWTKMCFRDTAEGQKLKIFKIFELYHVGCLYRGFLTRWIDCRCLFYSMMIDFCDNGQKPVFLNPWRVKIPWFQSSKLCNFSCLSRGFLTGWIDSWCLFCCRVIGFRDNGLDHIFQNPWHVLNTGRWEKVMPFFASYLTLFQNNLWAPVKVF